MQSGKVPNELPRESQPQRQQSFWTGLHRPHGAYFTCNAGRLRICEQDYGRLHEAQRNLFLIQAKREAEDTIQLYVKSLVAPLGYRIVRLRADRGTEYTGNVFREYCRQTAIQLEFTATNPPSQIGVSEHGRTLAGMTRSLPLGSGLPEYLWGGLMVTAAYHSNKSPHSALGMETPYKKFYGKEADVSLQDNRRKRFRPYRDLHQEAGQQSLGRLALRLQSGMQGLPRLQPGGAQGSREQECRVHRNTAAHSATA